MADLEEDTFIKIEDDYEKYIEYLQFLLANYFDVVKKIDMIVEKNIFTSDTYVQLTGQMKYCSKRVFPLLLAFLGQDDHFDEDIYPEFMDMQLMVLYLFDKLQYELDEILLKMDVGEEIREELIDLESVNYLLKLILPQLSLFANVFSTKISLIKGEISEMDFEKKMIELHDGMFL